MEFPLIAVADSPEEFAALVDYTHRHGKDPSWLKDTMRFYSDGIRRYGPGVAISFIAPDIVDGWCGASWYAHESPFNDWPRVSGWEFLSEIDGAVNVSVDVGDYL